MTLFFLRCCKPKPEAKPEIALQAYPTASPLEVKKLRLLDIFKSQHAVENAMFLCEYRDILIEQDQIKLETLRAQVVILFDRYILKDQAVALTVNGLTFSTITPTLNISDSLKSRATSIPTHQNGIYALLGDIYKDLMTNVVVPVLRENEAMDLLDLFKNTTTSGKKKLTERVAAVSKSSRGRMVSHVVESPSQRGKQAEKDDDGREITYARPH